MLDGCTNDAVRDILNEDELYAKLPSVRRSWAHAGDIDSAIAALPKVTTRDGDDKLPKSASRPSPKAARRSVPDSRARAMASASERSKAR